MANVPVTGAPDQAVHNSGLDFDDGVTFGLVMDDQTARRPRRNMSPVREPDVDRDATAQVINSVLVWAQEPRWGPRGRCSALLLLHALLRLAHRTGTTVVHRSHRWLAVEAGLTSHDQVSRAAEYLQAEGVLAYEMTTMGSQWELLTPPVSVPTGVCSEAAHHYEDQEDGSALKDPGGYSERKINNTPKDLLLQVCAAPEHTSRPASPVCTLTPASATRGAFRPEGFGGLGLLISQAAFDGRLEADRSGVQVTVAEVTRLFGLGRPPAQRRLSDLVSRGLAQVVKKPGAASVYRLRVGPEFSGAELRAANVLDDAEDAHDALARMYSAEERAFASDKADGFHGWAVIKHAVQPGQKSPLGVRKGESGGPRFMHGWLREPRPWIKSEASPQPDQAHAAAAGADEVSAGKPTAVRTGGGSDDPVAEPDLYEFTFQDPGQPEQVRNSVEAKRTRPA